MWTGCCTVQLLFVLRLTQLSEFVRAAIDVPLADNVPQPAAAAAAAADLRHTQGLHEKRSLLYRLKKGHDECCTSAVEGGDASRMPDSAVAVRSVSDTASAVDHKETPRQRDSDAAPLPRRQRDAAGQGNSGQQTRKPKDRGVTATTTTADGKDRNRNHHQKRPSTESRQTSTTAPEDNSSTTSRVSEHAEKDRRVVEAVASSGDRPENVVADWMWTASFVSVNTEKLILYSLLGVAFGSVTMLLVAVVLLRCRNQRDPSRRQPATDGPDGSRDALTATASSNVYNSSPSSDGRRPLAGGSPAWWSRDDDIGARIAKSPSGSLGRPSASAASTAPKRVPNVSLNGWVSEGDAASSATSGTAGSGQGLTSATGRDRSGRVLLDDIDDDDLILSNAGRQSTSAAAYGVGPTDGATNSWNDSTVGADGTGGTLGRSYTNPYRHDSYRIDGVRTMQFK